MDLDPTDRSGEAASPSNPDWWRGAAIYQIYPRSFADANGDGIGDLPGILHRLDHVASLGVDGIWLSPFFPSPMKDFGYDVADYTGVDPIFGTLDDVDRLLAGAHERGLKVIVDQVYSHTSDRHPWFLESRSDRTNAKADWYIWADPKPDGTPPNNWLSLFGGPAWAWDSRRRQYYLHNFHTGQPDLNFHNPDVRAAILDVARFWMDRGVDGLRLDVANFFYQDRALRDNPPAAPDGAAASRPYEMQTHLYDRSQPETPFFLEDLRAVLDRYPDRMAVAEIVSDRPLKRMADYTAGTRRAHTAYSFVFLQKRFSADFIRRAVLEMESGLAAGGWPAWAFSNHDTSRVASRWLGGDPPPPDGVTMLQALLLCLRGTAFVYQGEELGLPDGDIPFDRLVDPDGIAHWPEHAGRDPCRTPMPWAADAPDGGFGSTDPWLPLDPRHLPLAVDRQNADPDSALNRFRALMRWRQAQPVLRTGDIGFLDLPEPVLGFARYPAGTDGRHPDAILCLFNLSSEPIRFDLPAARYDAVADVPQRGGRAGGSVSLPAWGWLFSKPSTAGN